ncbi:MAG: putative transport system permease protein [Thermoleophilaceae bacterium]|nr:putative transport system permease protein [Thermoleophilaceae bacterium]
MLRYVWRDLVRNRRRTVASLVGVILGVGLFSGVLFFIDGSGATMTKRAIAPLALDMQRVLTSPLGGGLRLEERLNDSSLRADQATRVTLTVTNTSPVAANEVVVNDEPPPPLSYVNGTTTLDGRPLGDVGKQSPLAQGVAHTGYNVGALGAGKKLVVTYVARAGGSVPSTSTLRFTGKVSSREEVVPVEANAPPPVGLDELRAKIAAIPGVAAVDGLSFVDLPPRSLRAPGKRIDDGVRVFAFDRAYQQHYPSIRLASGSFATGSALLSAEAARTLGAGNGDTVRLKLPGRKRKLRLPVSGTVDLSSARPLFYSRKTNKLEDFLYMPNSIVVTPATFEHSVLPAYRKATATRGQSIKSIPLLEADVLVERGRLHSEPASAFAQTKAIAHSINRIAPGQDYLIDNISNTLQVARDDAAVGKRMFLFLGLPGALLAAFLAAYTGSILASTQRRENAILRIRGAHRGHLLRALVYRTVALASVGSVLGAGIGLLSVAAILGSDTLFEASTGDLLTSAAAAIGFGVVTTGLALYVPGRRALGRQVGEERSELTANAAPAWRRLRLDFLLLAVAAVAWIYALRTGAFDAPGGSVYQGQAVSLPSHLLLAPLVAWAGGMLLSVRGFETIAARVPLPSPPHFGPVVRGTLFRSLRRRSWTLATGIAGVGLVVAFGTSVAIFSATYDSAKVEDARFAVGSDLRVTPSVLSTRPYPASYASQLVVPGVAGAAPVVSKLQNSVLFSSDNEDARNLTAIDPASFRRVAVLPDAFFVDKTAAESMKALEDDPHGLLVSTETADDLSVEPGDDVKVLLARGTKRQKLKAFRVAGVFERFPGFPQGTDLIANLGYYQAATKIKRTDFFLARASDGSDAGLARAVASLRAGPGRAELINLETRATALDKDQSSLTAVNVHGLVDLNSLYTLLMSAAGIGIFVFGLMLQRRSEYVTLRAQGMRARELRALVLGEAALVALCGLVAGLVVGTGIGSLLVHVLRPLFTLRPEFTIPAGDLLLLAGLAIAATVVSALVATAMLRRLKPTELLRET